MSAKKLNLKELIARLVQEIDDVEGSSLEQREKTRKYQAAARKFKNAIFMDRRKFTGNGVKNRITLNTYNAYLTRARSKFDDRLHHSFEKSVLNLEKKYPYYQDDLNQLIGKPAAGIRIAIKALTEKLMAGSALIEKINAINFDKAYKKQINDLIKLYPMWTNELSQLKNDEDKAKLQEGMENGIELLNEIYSLKISHEVMYHLSLDKSERASLQARWQDVLDNKKRGVIHLDYPAYMQRLYDIIEYSDYDLSTRAGCAPLAFALAAFSGRRAIEILLTGEFKRHGDNTLIFSGQAKKRTDDNSEYVIYSLIKSDVFIELINKLRTTDAIASLTNIDLDDDETRSENGVVNGMMSKPLNIYAKRFFGDENRVFKDTRAIYARIVHELYFKSDPRWKDCDEDVFFSEILGHDDENTQLHYKQFKLSYFSTNWKPNDENTRLEALQALDDVIPTIGRASTFERIHSWVKEQVAANPYVNITSSLIRKELGSKTEVATRYMRAAADALGLEFNDNGNAVPVETKSLILNLNNGPTELEDDTEADELDTDISDDDEFEIDDDEEEEETEAPAEPEKPKFTAPKQLEDGRWFVSYEYAGNEHEWTGEADSAHLAMSKAWDETQNPETEKKGIELPDKMPKPIFSKMGNMTLCVVRYKGQIVIEFAAKGTNSSLTEQAEIMWKHLRDNS